jgi:hypothetical protein
MMEMEQEEEASVVPSPAEKSAGEAGETKS